MTVKNRYELDLTRSFEVEVPSGMKVRAITARDLDGLAQLMLDAYVGTIDYNGETLEDAVDEVRGFLENPASLLDRSMVVEGGEETMSAILVSMVEGLPFIAYVMTVPAHKEQGMARLLTTLAMRSLGADGHDVAALYVTDGNVASEALFRSLGARRVAG